MEQDDLIRKFFDGELSDEEERRVLHLIADSPELRSMLHFERKLSSSAKHVSHISYDGQENIPMNFSDRVMNRIEQNETSESHPVRDAIAWWTSILWKPRQIVLRPVYGFAVAVVLLASVALPFYLDRVSSQNISQSPKESVQQISETKEDVWLRFVYYDKKADSIAVAGDFSNWEPIPLSRQKVNGEQVWTGIVPMTHGEHRYMFVRNGKHWVTDPLATIQREDGFGNKNAVIYL